MAPEMVTAQEAAGWFRAVYKTGKVPVAADCEPLAAYLNEVAGITGKRALGTRGVAVAPNPVPAAVDIVLAAIDAALARMTGPGAISPNVLVPQLGRIRADLHSARHLIEMAPLTSGRSEAAHVADGVAAQVLLALRGAGRMTRAVGNNADGPVLKVVHLALARVGHHTSVGSILRNDPSPVKLVPRAARKKAQH